MNSQKGIIPWNKKEPIKIVCETCSNVFLVRPYRSKVAKFCGYPCYGEYRKTFVITKETREKMSKAKMGHRPYLLKHTDEAKRKISEAARKRTPEQIRKSLVKRGMSGLEEKVLKVIKKHNLPYKFVGDGKFFIERKVPDFINTNGKKIAVEVFWKTHKENLRKMSLSSWKKNRQEVFRKYGWEIIFIEGSGLTESTILEKIGEKTPSGEVD